MGVNTIASCGLSCSMCAIYQAHMQDDKKLKKIALTIYRKSLGKSSLLSLDLEDIRCEGCHSEVRFKYCQACDIRECCQSRGYQWCYQCADFPCRAIDNFPVSKAKTLMIEAAGHCRKTGHERWVAKDTERYTCKECSTLMFRGATRCKKCRVKLNAY